MKIHDPNCASFVNVYPVLSCNCIGKEVEWKATLLADASEPLAVAGPMTGHFVQQQFEKMEAAMAGENRYIQDQSGKVIPGQPRFCVDCKNYAMHVYESPVCMRPMTDLVTGKEVERKKFCWDEREAVGLHRCGPDARFFEVK